MDDTFLKFFLNFSLQQIWEIYTTKGDVNELKTQRARKRAVACLNEMITDALEYVPDCIEFMSMIKTEEIFRFCAIPQVTNLHWR